MSISVEVVEIGDSLGIILPREVREKLHVEVGDTLYLTATPVGVELTPTAPDQA